LAVCRCGKTGCLDAVASGYALQLRGRQSAAIGTSPFLASVAAEREPVLADILRGATLADPYCLALANESARTVGETIARMVNFFNPAMVLLGGPVMEVGDGYLAALRNMVYSRSLPLATRDLVIHRTALGESAVMIGAAHLVIDQLLEPDYYAAWGGEGVPPPL
jgi:predicted NBD/HSP70 family sugar kinase